MVTGPGPEKIMQSREIYEKKIQARLHELRAKIDKLREEAERAEANLELEYYTRVDELHLKLETANQKFQALKQASDEQWHEFKSEFELIWDSMRELIKSITSP